MHTEALNIPKGAELSCDGLSVDQTTDDSCSTGSFQNGPNDGIISCWKKSMIIKPRDPQFTNIFVVKKIDNEEATKFCLDIMKVLSSYKTRIFVEEACMDELKAVGSQTLNFDFYEFNVDEEINVDLLVVIGGDGSILWALKYFQNDNPPPILAFAKGTQNYLCNFSTDNYEETVKKVMTSIESGKTIQIEQRFRLHCEIFNKETGKKKTIYALNEVVMDRGINPTIVRLECYLEDKYFATFEGDGVMVATPTGSTAYQLSAGGPLVNHLNSSLTITPVAPMSLSTRPVVLPDNIKLTFKLHKDARKNVSLNADGQSRLEISKGSEVKITGARNPIPCTFDSLF